MDPMQHLPPELVRMITSNIHDLSDLVRSCQVNRIWNERFHPELYVFDAKNDRRALRSASIKGNTQQLQILIQLDPEIAERDNTEALEQAVIAGHVEYTQSLIQACSKDATDSMIARLQKTFNRMPPADRSYALHHAKPV